MKAIKSSPKRINSGDRQGENQLWRPGINSINASLEFSQNTPDGISLKKEPKNLTHI